MATFHERGVDQWQAKIRRRGYPTQSKTFETKAEAMAWARSIESGMDSGSFRPLGESQKTTVGELLKRYSKEISVEKRGVVQEQSRLRVIGSYPLADYAIANIGGKELAEYRDARLQVVKAKTVRDELGLIGHVFSVAVKDWGMVLPRGNPIDEVRKPRVGNNARDRRLEGDEEERLLAACKAHSDGEMHPIVILAIETGMRRGELAKIQWKRHVRLPQKIIHLTKDITKTETARDVPLSKRAVAVLEALPRRIDGKVFSLTPDGITQAFESACEKSEDAAGKPQPIINLHFHDLRHEATSRLFEKGLNPMQVAAITGHQTLQMLKRYTQLRAEDLVEMLG